MTGQPALNRYKIVTNIGLGERYKEKRLRGFMRGARARCNPSLKAAVEMRMPLGEKLMGDNYLERIVIDEGREDILIPLIVRETFEADDRVKALESVFVGHALQSENAPHLTLRQYAELRMMTLEKELQSIEQAKTRLQGVDHKGYAILNSLTEAGPLCAKLKAIRNLIDSGALERPERARRAREQAEQRVMKTMLEIIAEQKPDLVIVSRYLGETKVPGYQDTRI